MDCENCLFYLFKGGQYPCIACDEYNSMFEAAEGEYMKPFEETEKQSVSIALERFEELIRKEAILDKLMEGKDIYMYTAVKEGAKC